MLTRNFALGEIALEMTTTTYTLFIATLTTLLPVQFTALLCLPPDVWLILAWILCWAGKEEDWTKVVDRLTNFYVVE